MRSADFPAFRRSSTIFRISLALLALAANCLAQDISATITNAGGPSGTPVSPHFLIDSDAANASPAYNRDTIPGSVTVEYNWTGSISGSGTETFRVNAQLLDSDGNPVVLSNGNAGNQTVSTGPLDVGLGGLFHPAPSSFTQTYPLRPKPADDLGAGESFTLSYTVQRGTVFGFFQGQPLYSWSTITPPAASTAFVLIHFPDLPENPDARYIRGYLRGNPSWVKTHALQTASNGIPSSFRVSVPYTHARYDVGGSSASVQVRFIVEMEDNLGNPVPLENDGVDTANFTRLPFAAGTPETPMLYNFIRTINFKPAVQLDARNRTYRVRVRFEHLEIPPSTFQDNGTSGDSSLERLLHFNGNLRFGPAGSGLATVFSAYSNNPVAGALGTNLVNTIVNVTSGAIPGFPNYSYGDGNAINVQLLSNGDSVATMSGQPVNVAGGGDVTSDFNGVLVRYPGTILTPSGPIAESIIIRLPQGLSYTPKRLSSGGRYQPEIEFPGLVNLTNQFRHPGTLSMATPSSAWVFDESRTLLYQAGNFEFTQDGRIEFGTPEAEWVHYQAWEKLVQDQANGLHETQEMGRRMSNEGYLYKANTTGAAAKATFVAGTDGSVRCEEVDLILGITEFDTHFPLEARIRNNSLGQLKIRNGIVSSDSILPNVTGFTLSYDTSCPGDDCGPDPADAVKKFEITPQTGDLYLTADGGIFGHIGITPSNISWGLRGDLTAAHRSDVFTAGSFLASGNQIYHAANPLGAGGPLQASAGVLAPGVLTLAGYDEATHDDPLYPETQGYITGVGARPGATFTVESTGTVGASRLADMTSDYAYELQDEVTKYYVRRSGLSGRHVATKDGFDPGAIMYGYEFKITRFQLTFLSNENEDSWVNGGVSVPFPSNFSQSFLGLKLSCTGALEEAEIDPDDAGDKPLAYWNGSFAPITMRFAPEEGGGCYGPRFLTLGLVTGAANIPSPLAGSLAFLSNGNIAPLASGIEGVDGRLGLPARVPLDGPAGESYPLNPVSKLYFNDATATGAPPTGFVSFAATCRVPFFRDLKLHVMTSAKTDVPSPVYLASGWSQGGQDFFNNRNFDGTHRGFPFGVSAGDYQSPPASASPAPQYVVTASQSIFGLVPLNYPLRWNPNARFFQSWETVENELLVIEVQHQIDYLSAENAEISFGAQYDGLPKLNLVSAAYDAVEEQLGAARAITEAARGFVTDTLNQGVDEIGNLVNDTMERVLDQAVGTIEQQIINPLYDAVVSSYAYAAGVNQSYNDWVADGADGLKAQFDHFFTQSVVAGADTVKGQLQKLSDATGEGISLIKRVEDAVEQGILAIDSIAGRIELVGGEVQFNLALPPGTVLSPDSTALDGVIAGILAKVPVGGVEERQIVQRLVSELIRELAPPDLVAVLNPILAEITSGVNDELNQLLEKFDPTLDRIVEVLMQARGYLVTVREKLQAGGDILKNFQDIIATANNEINEIVGFMRTTAETFIDNIAASAASPLTQPLAQIGSIIDEFDKDEFVALIRAELRDRLLVTEFVQQIQYVLRQYISELDMAMRSAIDSAFGEVNRMCKQMIKKALGPIDEKINGLIGDINSVVGAGSIDGYAHIQGDTLRRLRLDAMVEIKAPDDLKLQAYFEMLCYSSTTSSGTDGSLESCLNDGEEVVEVRIGALDVPLDWISPGIRADFGVWFTMQKAPTVRPLGFGGNLRRTSGEIDFQSFKITRFSASVAVGAKENYLAASATVIVSDYEASGGIFFGRTCSIEPLRIVDPDAATVLGQPPFTGAYVYGEVWIPVSEVLLGIPASCMFRISAGVGAGAFFFVEGPTFGGKMLLGVSGEALCVVSIRGEVAMVGVMSGGSLRFTGRGTLTGKAGYCPFCLKFRKTARITYQNGSWSVDL